MNKVILSIIIAIFIITFADYGQADSIPFQPRFSSLSSDFINMRTGPGMQYPIEWVYKKLNYPIEIIEKYDVWRKVKDIDGTIGWIHQSMLSSRRYGIVLEKVNLTRSPDENANIIAIIEPEVIVKIIGCSKKSSMCRIETNGKHGFIPRKSIWGIHPQESF